VCLLSIFEVLTLPTGGQISVWPKTLEIFFPLFLFGDGRCVLAKFRKTFLFLTSFHWRGIWNLSGDLQIFPLHFITEELRAVLTKNFIFLYEISAALVYMGEMSTLTTHWR